MTCRWRNCWRTASVRARFSASPHRSLKRQLQRDPTYPVSHNERSFRTRALILKRRDFGEADRLLTLLTARQGKLDVIAKGARKPLSTKTGHVELYTCVDVLVHRGRELGMLVQVETVDPFLPLREDLTRSAYASYAAELLDRFTEHGDEDLHGIFDLLNTTFGRLALDDDPRLAVRYYEIRLLELVGFRPQLNECVISGEMILPEDQFFSFSEGGVVSPEHGYKSPTMLPVSMNALKLLRHMQRSPYSRVKSLKITPAVHAEVERILLGYISFLLERRLQSVAFIQQIRS